MDAAHARGLLEDDRRHAVGAQALEQRGVAVGRALQREQEAADAPLADHELDLLVDRLGRRDEHGDGQPAVARPLDHAGQQRGVHGVVQGEAALVLHQEAERGGAADAQRVGAGVADVAELADRLLDAARGWRARARAGR